MEPHLVKWHDRFASEGLSVIEIDDGNVDAIGAIRQWTEKDRIPFAVFYDAGGRMCERYEINSYPSQYLIGRDGKVVWQGGGWADDAPAAIEAKIREAMGK